MGFEQLAALRDQLAAQAAKNKRPERKSASAQGQAKDARPAPSTKPAQGKGRQAPSKPRRDAQPQVEPVVLNISRLQRQYPKAFPKRPEPKVPLKLGVHNDLYAQSETLGLTQPEIKEAIQTWCQGSRYWSCLTLDASRVDLAGEVVGTVTEAEAKRAKQLASRQRWQARNAQKKAAKDSKAQDDGAPLADAAPAQAETDGTPAAAPTEAPEQPAPVKPEAASQDASPTSDAATDSTEPPAAV